MRIGHISDLHILAISDVRPWEYLNKRLVGGLNLLLNRSKAHSSVVVERALEALASLDVDHIVISGDLTNLALDSEFAAAAEIIRSIESSSSRVSVVPGNHDYYTPGAASSGRFEHHFKDYLKSDLPEYQLERGYFFCYLRGEVAFVGLNSGIATPWLFATGKVDEDELAQAARILDDERLKSRFKVVVVHHPLMADEYHRFNFNRRLLNADKVLTTLREKNVDLVLHGHNHYLSVLKIPKLGEPGTTYVCEAGSTSMEGGDPVMAGKFNIYTVEDGTLAEIETHLFESHESGFRPFRSEVFRQKVEEEEVG